MFTAKNCPQPVLYLDSELIEPGVFKLQWCPPPQESGEECINGFVLEFREEGSDWIMRQDSIQGISFIFRGKVSK